MTVTIRVPSLRSLALVLVGAAIGAMLVAPVTAGVSSSAVEPMTTYTRTASCAALNFHPIDSRTGYYYIQAKLVLLQTSENTTRYFTCDPGLPNKAVVTRVRFTVFDNDPDASVSNCALVRGGLAATTATSINVLASVATTGMAATPGTVRLGTTSISLGTIDHAKFAYWLQCALNGSAGAVSLYGSDVTYTISAANG